jgi:prepilin-type N-terminal cleavage/methylation domain-containing protein
MEKGLVLLRKKEGFTLIELIVVLVIMGMLTAAIVPTVTQYVGTARETVSRSNLQMIENAAQLYLADLLLDGEFPNGLIITADELVKEGYLAALNGDEEYEIKYSFQKNQQFAIEVISQNLTTVDTAKEQR